MARARLDIALHHFITVAISVVNSEILSLVFYIHTTFSIEETEKSRLDAYTYLGGHHQKHIVSFLTEHFLHEHFSVPSKKSYSSLHSHSAEAVEQVSCSQPVQMAALKT